MVEANARLSKARPRSDEAYEALSAAIVRCELPPGTWMKASEIAELLGAGRTPTFQALLRLEEAGFTRPIKRKGWQITPVTLQSVHEILEALRLTAPGLVRLVIRNATDKEIATLCGMMSKWAPGLPASKAAPDYTGQPIRYMVEICANPMMFMMMRGLVAHVERVTNFGIRQGAFVDATYVKWRGAAFEALTNRDEKRARTALLKVIDISELEIKRTLQGTRSVRSAPIHVERAG